LKAITGACNQKSNRESMIELDKSSVQQTLDELVSELRQELERLNDGVGQLESKGPAG